MPLQTLGELSLPNTSLNRPKLLLFLAYLVFEGPQPRREMAGLFWPESPDPATNLRMALHHLRATAPGVVISRGTRLEAQLSSDLEPLLSAARLDQSEEVQRLYTGVFLDGVHGSWGAELEEWVFQTREYVAGAVRSTYLRAARRAAQASEPHTAAQLAAQAFQVPGAGPAELEDLPGLYDLLARASHPAAAEVRRVAGDLGLSLQPIVSSLTVSGLQPAAPEPEKVMPNDGIFPGQPRSPSAFVGRRRETGELLELLGAPEVRLLTLVGPGGTGKSRLAKELLLQSQVPGGGPRALVSLESLSDASLIASRICDALGLTPTTTGEALPFLVRTLGQQPGLLILDNFEHLLTPTETLGTGNVGAGIVGTEVVDTLLLGCPALRLLITSRSPLHHLHEQLYPLGGLDYGETGDALALFALRARRVRPKFALSADNAPHLKRICALLDGSPLGLELAASWARTLPIAELAAELGRNLDVLSQPQSAGAARHASLRAVFGHSWTLLGAQEQAALRQLSVFQGGFTREAAGAIAGATLTVLASLVDQSLLRLSSGDRFQLHPLVHQYASEQLAPHPQEEAAARRAHAHFFVRLAQGASPHLYTSDQERWFGLLAEDHANMRAASNWGLTHGEPDIVAELQRALWIYVWCREDHAWGQAQLEAALRHPRLSASGRAVLVMTAGSLSRIFGDPASARVLLDEAVDLTRDQNLPDMLMLALLNRGMVLGTGGQEHAARRDLEACLAVASGLGNPALESYAYTCLGEILNHQGDHQAAENLLTLALHKARRHAGGWYLYKATLIFANHLRDRGRLEEAQQYYQTCLDQLGRLGRSSDLAECLAEQGRALWYAGEGAAAQTALQESLRRLRLERTVDPRVAGLGLGTLAELALDEGRPAEAAACLFQAMQEFQRTDAGAQLALLIPSFVRLHRMRGNVDLAGQLLQNFDDLSSGRPLVTASPLAERLQTLRRQVYGHQTGETVGQEPPRSLEEALRLCLHDVQHPFLPQSSGVGRELLN